VDELLEALRFDRVATGPDRLRQTAKSQA